MKKLIVLLLALAVVGSAVYAQDVKTSWSAYLDTGFKYNAGTDTLMATGYDSGTASGRFNLNGSWSYGDFGLKFRLRAQPFYADSGYQNAFVRRAYVYYKLLGGKVELDSGILGVASYYTPYNGYGTGDDPNKGFAVQAFPMNGLSVAYFVPVTIAGDTLANAFKNSNVAVAYSVPKFADFLFVAKTVGQANVSLIASANITAVDKLSAIVEFENSVAVSGTYNNVTEYFAYDLSPLSVSVAANQHFSTVGAALYWNVNPGVSYTVSKVTSVGADLGYDSAGVVSGDAWAKFSLGKNYIKTIGAYDTGSNNFVATVAMVSSF